MSLQFLIAPRVQAGNVPNARDMVGLAEAANVKDRSGLGDNHYRVCDYAINWARQFRNPDETGNSPTMGEWWEIYAYLNPQEDIPTIPEAGPGEPEGTNATCPPVVFQFGNDSANLFQEEDRLGIVDLWNGIRPAQTPEEWWELGKRQRGVFDPSTQEQNVPSIEAARSVQGVQWNTQIPHGKTTGGSFPTPVIVNNDCDEGSIAGQPPIPSFQYKFTALRDDVVAPDTRGAVTNDSNGRLVITYDGSCPYNTLDTTANDVQEISRGSRQYVVVFVDGLEVLSRTDWLEGPYDQDGQLTRYNAEHFSRAVWAFVNDFRGTPTQRDPDTFDIQDVAFDFEAFNTKQYLLSPNLGFDNGAGLVPAYPTAQASASSILPSGTLLNFGGRTDHIYTPGFVFNGCFAKATNLSQPVSLQVLNGKQVLTTLTLTPDEPQAIFYLADAVFPNANLSVKLATDARFSAPGEIVFEATELLEYKPDHWDAYMLLRLASTLGGDETGTTPFLDGAGIDKPSAAQIYKNYLAYGCVVNTNAAGVRSMFSAMNENPVYDAQRRLLLSLFRMVRRQELLSYEYDSLGRPVIRAKRWAYGLKNSKADLFEGIAPSYKAVSEIQEGIVYVVRSHTGGKINYNSQTYALNQRFTGLAGVSTFDVTGDAIVLEYEGIRPVAAKKGWTNEWLMSEEFHFENPNADSLWYPDHYADWYVRGNRCHTYARVLDDRLTRMADIPVVPGADPSYRQLHLSPELPSGWNYTLSANAGASPDFCSSCQIYKEPYELASATVEFDSGGNDIVRLVFKAPFQRDPSAPTSFGPDPTTWNITDLRAEPYRTTDNGLREYFYYIATGTHGSWKVGDGAYSQNGGIAGLQSLDDKPFGCIFPRLFFTSLVKKPYLDGNDTLDDHDTRITIDELFKLEIKLKCWCEGAIDGFSSVQHLCGGGSFPFDFTYENLKLKAFGGVSIGSGHGPMVNTKLEVETFNQIAACLDELFMFRVEGLMELQAKGISYTKTSDVTATWGNGSGYLCPPGGGLAAYYDGGPATPEFDHDTAWTPTGGFTASVDAVLTQCGPGGASLGMISDRFDFQYRYVPLAGYENAIPPNVQDLVSGRNFGIIGTLTRSETVSQKVETSDPLLIGCSSTHYTPTFTDGVSGWYFTTANIPDTVECVIFSEGTLSAGTAAPSGSYSICSYPDATTGSFSTVTSGCHKSVHFASLNPESSAIIVVPMVEQEAAT